MDLAITGIETITAFDIVSGNYLFTLDELQNVSIGNTEEKQEVLGKQGRKITSLKRNKAVSISGTNGLVSGGLLELQTGGKFENKATEVLWADHLSVSGNKATTTYKAVGTTGNEIDSIYVKNSDNTLGKKLEQDATASATSKFAYSPDTKEITFFEGDVADGTEVIVYYKRKIQADVLENLSDNYSKKCEMFIDCLAEDICSNVFRIQIHVPKADFSGEFTLDMGDSSTVHNFNAEAMAGACGGSAALWSYVVFGADTEDAE